MKLFAQSFTLKADGGEIFRRERRYGTILSLLVLRSTHVDERRQHVSSDKYGTAENSFAD